MLLADTEQPGTLRDVATGDVFARAELERLYGRLLLQTGERSESRSALERALALARRQGAGLFELRAAMDLAELFVANCDNNRARDILAPVVESYHEHREGADYSIALTLLNKDRDEQTLSAHV